MPIARLTIYIPEDGTILLIYPPETCASRKVNLPGSLAPHDAFLPGINGSLSAISEMQFTQDIADMPLDRTNADDKVFSNFLVRETSGNQRQYFNFSLGEFCEKVAPVWF